MLPATVQTYVSCLNARVHEKKILTLCSKELCGQIVAIIPCTAYRGKLQS